MAKSAALYNVMIARTGYTGEDGFEIYIPSDEPTSSRVWGEVLNAGAEFGILPCGLGARNTLRLESAMALYGHEISDTINVFEAGLGRYAKLDKGSDFVGRAALAAIESAGGPKRKLVGLEMIERGIGRDGYPVCTVAGERIGHITSGSPAPSSRKTLPSPTCRSSTQPSMNSSPWRFAASSSRQRLCRRRFTKDRRNPPSSRIHWVPESYGGAHMAYPCQLSLHQGT